MQRLTIFVALVLAASPSLAAPTSETHFLTKRDSVCGLDFRSLVDHDSCIPNKTVFVLGDRGAPQVVQKTQSDVSLAKLQCDHVVELQLLDKVAKSSGLCNVLSALQAASPANTKVAMLRRAADSVSKITNLNFLDSKINNQKKTVVQRALNRKDQGKTAEDKAVANYLAMVKNNAKAVASAVDRDFAAIIASAKRVHDDLPAGKTVSSKRKDPKKSNLEEALKKYKVAESVSAEFTEVLDAAAKILG